MPAVQFQESKELSLVCGSWDLTVSFGGRVTVCVDVVVVEDFGVHHDLPGVNGQIGVVERPVELLLGNGLISRVVVRREVRVGERGTGLYAGTRVEDQHLLKKLNSLRVCVLELVLERLALALGQRLDESKGVLAADGADNIIWRGSEQFGDDGELVDVILSGEKGFALEHLGEDAPCAPDVYFDVVLLPREHDLRCSVISRRDIAGHLRVLDTGKAKVANLQIAVLVDENVGGFEVTVDNASGVDVFQTTQDLVEEVLDELLLKRARGEEAVQVGAQELGDNIHVLERGNEDIAETDDVLMAQVLEQLQLTVCALGQDRRAEWLHNLLDCNRRGSELILGRAYKPEGAHAHRLQIRVPARDLKGGAENLGSHEFRHDERVL